MSDNGLTYRETGVDLEKADALKERLRELVEGTRTEGVRAGYGSFGGRYHLDEGGELVASADGVGTKLKVAFRAGVHDTVGHDLVNHCVNDVLAEGAEPLFFMDYVAAGELEPDVTLGVVEGVARGCRENGCALLGGETAEMPDFYGPGEYELAGFILGRVAFPAVAARELRAGDRLLGLASSGIHTNGYSFARRVVFDRMGLSTSDPWPGPEGLPGAAGRGGAAPGPGEGAGPTVGDVLLRVHRSYLGHLRAACAAGRVHGLAHVTGGGIAGNLERLLPDGLDARVELDGVEVPGEFRVLERESGAERAEMYRVFNMGVGMIAAVRPGELEAVRDSVEESGCRAFPCGRLEEGSGRVHLQGVG